MASAIASTDEKNPMCASPTFVQTRTWGSAIETSLLISPAPLMPSSTTAQAGAVCSSNNESGSPMWLFRLPRLRNVVKRCASSVAVISLVVVLPALPVIATTVDAARRRITRAASCRPISVSSTAMTGSVVDVTADASLTTTAPAPRATASVTNACPSNRGPRIATNMSPGAMVRVSIDTVGSSRSAGPRASTPPKAAAISAAVSANGVVRITRLPACGEAPCAPRCRPRTAARDRRWSAWIRVPCRR